MTPAWPIRQRPAWVVVLLTILSLGCYGPVWFAQTWAELKRAVRDPGMSPFWHGLSLAVPLYNLFRIHAHFRTINDQSRLRGLALASTPSSAVLGVVLGSWLAAALVGLLMIAAVMASGQRALNRIWAHDFGSASQKKACAGEWISVVVLAGLISLAIYSLPITLVEFVQGPGRTNPRSTIAWGQEVLLTVTDWAETQGAPLSASFVTGGQSDLQVAKRSDDQEPELPPDKSGSFSVPPVRLGEGEESGIVEESRDVDPSGHSLLDYYESAYGSPDSDDTLTDYIDSEYGEYSAPPDAAGVDEAAADHGSDKQGRRATDEEIAAYCANGALHAPEKRVELAEDTAIYHEPNTVPVMGGESFIDDITAAIVKKGTWVEITGPFVERGVCDVWPVRYQTEEGTARNGYAHEWDLIAGS